MKRVHRRFHILMWLVLAPTTLGLSAYFWMQRPQDVINDDAPSALQPIAEIE